MCKLLLLTLQANVSNTHGINFSREPKYTDTDCPTDSAASSNIRNFFSCVIVSPPKYNRSTSIYNTNTSITFLNLVFCIYNLKIR